MPLPSGVEQRYSRSGTEEIFSGAPTRYSVAVRPVQNKQGVGTPIIREVSSGGGGVVPESQLLYDSDFDIITGKFEIKNTVMRGYSVLGAAAQEYKVYTANAYNVVTNEYEFIEPANLHEQRFIKPTQTNLNPADFDADVTFTASTGGDLTITPSFVSPSTPFGDFYKFVASTSTGQETSIRTNESNWAKIAPDTAVAVESGESIGLKAAVAMQNWGDARCNFYLINNDTGDILSKTEHQKGSILDRFPDGTGVRNTKTMTVNWENVTSSTINVRWEIRGWGYVNNASAKNPSLIHVFVKGNSSSGNNYHILSGTIDSLTYTNEIVNFRSTPIDFAFVRDETITNDSVSYATSDIKLISFDSDRSTYAITFAQDPNSSIGDEFYIGVNKPSRFIHREDLNVDYRITSISVNAGYATNVTGDRPGIIRVYPNGEEGSSVNLEIEGIGTTTLDELTFNVRQSGNSRYFTVDAYDDSNLPNNRAEIRGRITVRGEPLVKNNLTS